MAKIQDPDHLPDYSTYCEQVVEGENHDIVIFGCQCGNESCTWQVLIRATDMSNHHTG